MRIGNPVIVILGIVLLSSAETAAQTYKWVDTGTLGDYNGQDRGRTCSANVPAAAECGPGLTNTTAVCWPNLASPCGPGITTWCAIKSALLGSALATHAESRPGRIWVCRQE